MIGFEILNLKHRHDRKDICIGNFITQDVPYEVVTFHKAIFGGDYESAREVCAAAVADGFEEFAESCEMGGRGDVAYHWGVMRILEKIMDIAYPYPFAYFNQDDRLLPRDVRYADLEHIAEALLSVDPNFLFLQLSWHASEHAETERTATIKPDNFFDIGDFRIYKGIFSYGDSGLLMSKAGARFIREQFAETPDWLEGLIYEKCNVPGAYALWKPFTSIIEGVWCGYPSDAAAQDRLRVNETSIETEDAAMQINIQQKTEKTEKTEKFVLRADQEFYMDHIPNTARHVFWGDFLNLPNLEQNICLLDDRWSDVSVSAPAWTDTLTEIETVQENRSRSDYEWVCGFSVFFMKDAHNPNTEHAHRTLPETHANLIKGVSELLSYPDRCPETLLRFYVSAEVWDRLSAEGLLSAPDTEFCKMVYNSEESNLGTMWRLMCLSDAEFQWAIETDCAPSSPKEHWIYPRIDKNHREFFKRWLTAHRTFSYGSEFLIYPHNWDPEQGELRVGNMQNNDFLSSGSIVSRPKEMPDIENLVRRHIAERLNPHVFYHKGENIVCAFSERAHAVPYGWEGFGPDQEMWRFLKKTLPTRHLLQTQSREHMQKVEVPEDHFMKRIISQLIAEGSEFVDIETQEPIFEMI